MLSSYSTNLKMKNMNLQEVINEGNSIKRHDEANNTKETIKNYNQQPQGKTEWKNNEDKIYSKEYTKTKDHFIRENTTCRFIYYI